MAVALAGCGADHEFRKAAFLESARRYPSAVSAFERFARRHPSDPRAGQALVRAARIHSQIFGRCSEARLLYERAAREVPPSEPWVTEARLGLLDCPEYFPLRDGMRWVYVDSQTGGRNMRLELEVSGSPDRARGDVTGAYYAGRRRVQRYARSYVKRDWAVWELSGKDRIRILRFPFQPGMVWRERREGRPVEFRIESDRETVKVRAGTFRDCLKLREAVSGLPSWKYEYYAPGVGKVKTTVGGPGFEAPNTELGSIETRGRM